VAVPSPPPTAARADWLSEAAPSLPPCASPHQKSTPLAVLRLYLLLRIETHWASAHWWIDTFTHTTCRGPQQRAETHTHASARMRAHQRSKSTALKRDDPLSKGALSMKFRFLFVSCKNRT